jgi:hypothetical protein
MITIIIILVAILAVSVFVNINLFRKLEVLEGDIEFNDKLVESVYISMMNAYTRMKSLDRLGAFESDDETGYIFTEIKSAMEELNNEYNLDGDTQEKE